ncbi:MAG: zinc ABC transporter substrate-binding protein [Treponema sp.]|nr:zinc ABC transporter substrate-binding protein [Treponema sp.]
MKKIYKILIAALLLALTSNAFAASKKSIVCTTFPQYDWVMNILGDKAQSFEVTLLLNKGTDLHSYQPSVKDIAKISVCDLFVYVGGESDEWVEKVLDAANNKSMLVVNMMQTLGDRVYEEELVEGMQGEEEEEEEGEEEEPEYDEHIWLSLKNAVIITEQLSEQLQKLDSKNAAVYKSNAAAYINQLKALDAQYSQVVAQSGTNILLFGDRFPFRYLTEDYGLKYYAAFIGCSAESEASFETITFLAQKLDELKLKAVITLEKSDKKIAKTIVASSSAKNQTILEMDSIQSINQKEIKAGKTYLSAMKKNLEVLKEALR